MRAVRPYSCFAFTSAPFSNSIPTISVCPLLLAEERAVHFAEETKEYYHLLFMEALGGDQRWAVRFRAQHCVVAYFWVHIFLFLVSPSLAYGFSVLLETHAVETYDTFLGNNRECLEELPVPPGITNYYDSLQYYLSTKKKVVAYGSSMRNLYDVFFGRPGRRGRARGHYAGMHGGS